MREHFIARAADRSYSRRSGPSQSVSNDLQIAGFGWGVSWLAADRGSTPIAMSGPFVRTPVSPLIG